MEVSEFFHHNNPHQLSTLDNNNNMVTTSEPFVVEELLNLPSDDDPFHMDNVGSSLHSFPGDSITNSSSSLTNTVLSSSASNFNVTDESATTVSRTLPEAHLSSDLCVPVPDDDLAQLELVSSVAEETFSNEDLQNLQIISGVKVEPTEIQEFQGETNQSMVNNNNNNSPIFESDVSIPAKARSKRPRVTSCNWATRPLHVSSSNSPCPSLISSASTPPDTDAVVHSPAAKKRPPARRKDPVADNRRCFHCSTNHTPQWRTGPMGPKTLCNACGVRYKSGRLVPEYRPAASPTFVLTEHSNSHRKVMELRRQKDMMQHQHQHRQFLQHPHMMFEFQHVTNADDYLIHQHLGHDFMQLIG